MTVGIFGLGLIGQAVAARLLSAGHTVRGHDPAPGQTAALGALGGQPCPPQRVWASDTVILAVFDAAQACAVLSGRPPTASPDIVILTTCDPAGISAIAAAAGPCAVVEAPVSGTSAQLAVGAATIWLAGDPAALDRVMPLAQALAPRVTRLGPLGDGARVKLCVNLILGLNRAALAEGLTLARALGLDPGAFLDLARNSAAASAVMATKGPRMVSGDFTPEGRVAQSAKDFGLILNAAAQAGQTLPFAATYAGLMGDLVAAGDGDLDNAAIIRALAADRTGPVTIHKVP